MFQGLKKFISGGEKNKEPERREIEYFDNSATYDIPEYKVTVDEDGYVQSFSIDQEDQYKEFFNKYGFVVIRDVLNDKQCQDTIDDMWNYIETDSWRYRPPVKPEDSCSVKRDQPNTWLKNWPSMEYIGILGSPSVFTKAAIENRANLNIYKVYSSLLGRQDIIINHDRYGFFRPTIDILNPMPRMSPHHTEIKEALGDQSSKRFEDQPDWKTSKNLHLDMNPWAYLEELSDTVRQRIIDSLFYDDIKSPDFIIENNEVGNKDLNELHIQGLINLADNQEDDGGFLIVPGFPNHIEEWSINNKTLRNNNGLKNKFILIPEHYPLFNRSIRLTAKAGSLLLWNQKMVHGSSPNNSSKPRLAQFIKMTHSTYFNKEKSQLRSNIINKAIDTIPNFDKNSDLNELQQKILGLQQWSR